MDAEELLASFFAEGRLDRFEQVLRHRTHGICVVLDGVHGTHNIAAVMRSADAFGVSQIYFIGEAVERASSISLGTERWLEMQHLKSAEDALRILREQNRRIVVLQSVEKAQAAGKPSCPVYDLPFEAPLALVFGNEHSGVSQTLFGSADICAHIPMLGFVESLNVSVAAAITLFCSTLSGATGQRRPVPLTEAEKDTLRSRWLRNDHRHADVILREVERRLGKQSVLP